VIADPLVIERVVSNLLINASRYGKPPVTVQARRDDRHLRITVEDRGDGIPNDLRPRIFDRFARSDNSTSSGPGLAIARAYARDHGGDLLYEPLDPGSRFTLLTPQD
jgi:two-component system sensor histidine kinase MtrB